MYKILLDVQSCVLAIMGCSEVFYTLFASRLFSRPCATPKVVRTWLVELTDVVEEATDALDDQAIEIQKVLTGGSYFC